jgi:hypothetical protein
VTTHTSTFVAHIFDYNMLGQEKLTRQHAHSNPVQKRGQNVFFSFLPLLHLFAEKLKKNPKIKERLVVSEPESYTVKY